MDDRKERDRKIERNHLTLLAATNEGFKNLTTLSSKGFLEGLYRGKPGVDLELLAEHAEGVICLTGCLASRTSQRIVDGQARRRPRASRRARPGVRPRGRLSRGPEERADRAGAGQRGDARLRRRDRPPDGRDGGRPLPPQGGLPPPRGAAVRADEVDAGRAEDVVHDERVLFEVLRGDGGVVRRLPGRAGVDGRDRRALRGRHRARRPADPALRLPGRAVREGVPAQPRRGRPARTLRRSAVRRGRRADGDGARRHRQHGLQRLLPDRLGLRQLRQVERDRGRPGPRLRGRQHRRPTRSRSRTSIRSPTTCCSSAS